jgi:hypothetical protein
LFLKITVNNLFAAANFARHWKSNHLLLRLLLIAKMVFKKTKFGYLSNHFKDCKGKRGVLLAWDCWHKQANKILLTPTG